MPHRGVPKAGAFGCAHTDKPWGCHVVLAPDTDLKSVGLTRDMVLRHEVAHCNGWPNDHRGALPIEDWAPDETDAPDHTPAVMKVAAQFDDFARGAVGKNVMNVADDLAPVYKVQFINAAVAIGLTPGSQ